MRRRAEAEDVAPMRGTVTAARPFDVRVTLGWAVSLVVSFIIYLYLAFHEGKGFYEPFAWLSAPFVVAGAMYAVHRRSIGPLIVVVLAVTLLIVVKAPWPWVVVALFLIMGAVGSSCVVGAVARLRFYPTMRRIRLMNIKPRRSLADRFTAFVFDVPSDMDTRSLAIEPPDRRHTRPRGQAASSMALSLPVLLVIWVILIEAPHVVTDAGDSAPIFLFTLLLYVPVAMLPVSVYRSAGARIVSGGRSFEVRRGLTSTLSRLTLPVAMALVILMAARWGDPGFDDSLRGIALSGLAALFSTGAVCAVYLRVEEREVVSDIGSKWGAFMPVDVLDGGDVPGGGSEDFPGTPKRDRADTGAVRIPTAAPKKRPRSPLYFWMLLFSRPGAFQPVMIGLKIS